MEALTISDIKLLMDKIDLHFSHPDFTSLLTLVCIYTAGAHKIPLKACINGHLRDIMTNEA